MHIIHRTRRSISWLCSGLLLACSTSTAPKDPPADPQAPPAQKSASLESLIEACLATDTDACLALAQEHQAALMQRSAAGGLGLNPSEERALFEGISKAQAGARLSAHRQACAAGNGEDCVAAGVLWQTEGIGIEPDREQALEAFSEACHLGSGQGCVSRADLLVSAADRLARADEIVALYQAWCAAPQQRHAGCLGLARVYNRGVLRTRDPARALEAALLGCTPGNDAAACRYAACQLSRGAGLDPDPQRAQALFDKACAVYPGVMACDPPPGIDAAALACWDHP